MSPQTRRLTIGLFAPGLLCLQLLSGCTTPRKDTVTSATADNAYIVYWPAPADSKRLRVAVKDLIDMKGVVTTAGSEYLSKNSPAATEDAACLAIARQRGVSFVGKANLTEFAISVSGINDYFGTPRNPLSPWRPLIPGGSSSGSAVAVASNSADVSFATDTAGSIRVPAACCGVVGLKTTFGLVPLKGVYPIAPSTLDTVGPIGKDIAATVQGMDLLQQGFAAKYRRAQAANPSADKIRIGRLYLKGTDPDVDRAVDRALAARGFQVIRLSDRFREKWVQADKDAKIVAAVGAWVNSGRFTQLPGVSARTKIAAAVGGFAYRRAGFREAMSRRAAWKAALRDVFEEVDFIALPTMQELPPMVPLLGGTPAFEAHVFNLQNTAAVNFGGNPALAVPVPVRDWSVPVTSLQLVGRPFSEAELLNAGRVIEGEAAEMPDTQRSRKLASAGRR